MTEYRQIEAKTWTLVVWEIHHYRYLMHEIVGALRACSQMRHGRPDHLGRSWPTLPPLGIHVAVGEVDRLIKEFEAERLRGFSMTVEEMEEEMRQDKIRDLLKDGGKDE